MENYTSLHIAYKEGYVDIAKFGHSPQMLQMRTKNTDELPYQIAYHYNQYDVVKLLLEMQSLKNAE